MSQAGSPRVIVVAPGKPGVGGLGTAARDIADGMTACGAAVTHVTLEERPTPAMRAAQRRPLRRAPALGRRVERREMARRIPPDWDVAYAMPGFLPAGHDRRTRVVHAATHHPLIVREAVAAARRRTGGGRGFMTGAEARMLVRELHDAHVIRAESLVVADELRNDPGVRGSVILAPPGVDLERFRPAPKAGRLTVAFVGTFSLWKGVDILVELARRLEGIGTLATIGGPVCSWSRRLCTSAPFVPRGDVAALLGESHALVLPSASDGFGYVVLEAMASGTVPFVTPEVGSAELVARIDARLVQPAATFADAVSELLTTLPLAQLGSRARQLAAEFEQDAMRRQAAERILRASRAR